VKKKMRVQVLILRESEAQGLVPDQDLDAAINTAKQVFLDRFKVEIRAYANPIVETLADIAPAKALDVGCDSPASPNSSPKAPRSVVMSPCCTTSPR
jgi:hypothetical protein